MTPSWTTDMARRPSRVKIWPIARPRPLVADGLVLLVESSTDRPGTADGTTWRAHLRLDRGRRPGTAQIGLTNATVLATYPHTATEPALPSYVYR